MRTRNTLPHPVLIDAIFARDGDDGSSTTPTSRGFAKEIAETMNTWRSVGQRVSHFETRIHLMLRRSRSARGGVMGHVG